MADERTNENLPSLPPSSFLLYPPTFPLSSILRLSVILAIENIESRQQK